MILSKTYLRSLHSQTSFILATERSITDRDDPELWRLKLFVEQEEWATFHPTADLVHAQDIGNGW